MEMDKLIEKYSRHLFGLCDTSIYYIPDRTDKETPSYLFHFGKDDFCSSCKYSKCDLINTHLYGSQEARRWGGKYIYYCPLGLIFITSAIYGDKGLFHGCIVAGPAVMGDLSDTMSEVPIAEMKQDITSLSVISTKKANDIAAILEAITTYISSPHFNKSAKNTDIQSNLLNLVHSSSSERITKDECALQMFEYERHLLNALSENDIAQTKALLNELLGRIFFSGNYEFSDIKTRCVEILVLISRSSIEAGADITNVLNSNTDYLHIINAFTSIEELSVWLTNILYQFIDIVFEFSQIRHSDMVYKTMEYIKSNYNQKLSLDDIAGHVFLSRSYVSSVFKKETNESLSSYINRIRIEKSKAFLLDRSVSLVDIAGLCGYDDQSYFSKVFKKAVGISPKKFRDSGGRG